MEYFLVVVVLKSGNKLGTRGMVETLDLGDRRKEAVNQTCEILCFLRRIRFLQDVVVTLVGRGGKKLIHDAEAIVQTAFCFLCGSATTSFFVVGNGNRKDLSTHHSLGDLDGELVQGIGGGHDNERVSGFET